jgi:hypothetical protein
MKIEPLITKHKKEIVSLWKAFLIHSYPGETAQFLKSGKDQFANPAGHAINEAIPCLVEALEGDINEKIIREQLDPIIRIRTIQNFSPVQAVGFIGQAKDIARSVLKNDLKDLDTLTNYLDFELKIDQLSALGYDLYIKCKEDLANIAVERERRKISGLMRKYKTTDGPQGEEDWVLLQKRKEK